MQGVKRTTVPASERLSIRFGRFELLVYGSSLGGGRWVGQVIDREHFRTIEVREGGDELEAKTAALAALADLRDALIEVSARDAEEQELVGLLRPLPEPRPEPDGWQPITVLRHPDCVCDGDLCEGRMVLCLDCERSVPECTALADRYCAACTERREEVPC